MPSVVRPGRRQVLKCLGAGAAGYVASRVGATIAAQQPEGLLAATTGLEHLGLTVREPEVTARFYGRIFDPQLFQEREPPPRFYVRLGIAYLAVGGNANVSEASIDHFCVLMPDYKPQDMRKSLEAASVPLGAGPLGMASDPDGLRLQLLGVPGGLARTVVPAFRISHDDAIFQAIGLDHVLLRVSDLERSVAHYRKLFGAEIAAPKKPARVWFKAARTRIGLEPIAGGEKATVQHVCVRVAGFDRKAAVAKLERAGVELVPSSEDQTIRFRDPNGLTMELMAG